MSFFSGIEKIISSQLDRNLRDNPKLNLPVSYGYENKKNNYENKLSSYNLYSKFPFNFYR